MVVTPSPRTAPLLWTVCDTLKLPPELLSKLVAFRSV